MTGNRECVSDETIVVRGLTIDLDAVYRRMQAEAEHVSDGTVIYSRGLKYLL